MKKRAFTLVELMVVLAVIAIISTITFGVISNTVSSNRRAQCAANMAQIYGALRLYSQDYDGQFPYFNPVETGVSSANIPQTIEDPLTPEIEMKSGLWRLVQYANGTKTGYLKNQETLYSPVDPSERRANDPTQPSYQFLDDGDVWTYATFREANSRRQLRFTDGTDTPQRRPSDTTVVMWSRWHRKLNTEDPFGTRNLTDDDNRDNVLFFDGRVQSLPIMQNVTDTSGNAAVCEGWRRVPKEFESKMYSVDTSVTPNICQPTP